MFPALQMIQKKDLDMVGHFFLIVLNLCSKMFEVLDSMRTLQDELLRDCCNTVIAGIKTLWKTNYPETTKHIDNYELVDIGVPAQSNK